MTNPKEPSLGEMQATTLEEVAAFCMKRYREAKKQPERFTTDIFSLNGQLAAYAAIYRIITGRHPDTGEGKA